MGYSVFSPSGFSSKNYTISSVWKAIEKTTSWQEAVLLVSVSVLVTGVAFVIIASLIPASPASSILSMVGLRFLEIGMGSTVVSAISICIGSVFRKKKKAAQDFSKDLIEHTISIDPKENIEKAKMEKTK